MQETKRILIVKLSSIGDVVHSLPFLDVINERFPHARIDWLVEEASSVVLAGHPGLSRLIISRRKTWQKNLLRASRWFSLLAESTQLLKAVRAYPYDLVIDLQGLFRSGVMVGVSRGKRKIGMAGAREGGGWFITEKPVPVDYAQHAVDRYLQVAEYLGCNTDSWKGHIPVRDADKAKINPLVSDARAGKRPIVAINPMARWETKLWQSDRFAALADRLSKELSCRIIFTGSRQDRAIIEAITGRMREDAINLAGRTSLKELAYLYTVCNVLVTTDTGPMHIGAAMGCPVIALFGPTDPLRTGPYGQGHQVIRSDIACSPCFKKKCEHMTCMKKITVDRCVETVKNVLS